MLSKREIKALARTHSWRFAREVSSDGRTPQGDATIRWRGHTVHYRTGTGDASIINDVLLRTRGEYWLPDSVQPHVILDIGANIGIAALYYAERFPTATIHCFEPVPANYGVLESNTCDIARVHRHAVALGSSDRTQTIAMAAEKNFGSFSLYERGVGTQAKAEISVRHAGEYLQACGIDRVDLIKIDTEGAEHEILTTIPPAILQNVQWIAGELHGVKDFELLAYLSAWFDIGMQKSINKRLFMFQARNRNIRPAA